MREPSAFIQAVTSVPLAGFAVLNVPLYMAIARGPYFSRISWSLSAISSNASDDAMAR